MQQRVQHTFGVYEISGNQYNDSHCGPGSTLEYTESIRKNLVPFLSKHHITSIFDCPCGAFNWMSAVDFGDIEYVGGDVIKSIVDL
jgi:hypothetical protein